jgi:hypothetical protein
VSNKAVTAASAWVELKPALSFTTAMSSFFPNVALVVTVRAEVIAGRTAIAGVCSWTPAKRDAKERRDAMVLSKADMGSNGSQPLQQGKHKGLLQFEAGPPPFHLANLAQ